jgi:hypothetical protein
MKATSTTALSGQLTTEQIAATSARVASQRDPEFIRLPKTGTLCPHTGLTRSKMNELVLPCPQDDHKPPVKSVCLRQRGAIKGVRLVVFKSLIEYIRQQATDVNAAA